MIRPSTPLSEGNYPWDGLVAPSPPDALVLPDAPSDDELNSALSRRRRRLGALEALCRTKGCGESAFRALFASAAPPIYAYYALIGVFDLPDILDDPSSEVDFLLTRTSHHPDVCVAAGLLASGVSLGRVATRAVMLQTQETYGDFSAWVLLRASTPNTGVAAALPARDYAYAIGHGGYRVYAAQQRPALDKWVDAICVERPHGVLIDPSSASASYRVAREHFLRWEAFNAAHQG